MKSIILSQIRSSSMPSRSYPLIPPEFDLHSSTLKSENDLMMISSSSSLPSISEKLRNLENVYDCVENLLHLPHTQQVFTRERNEKWVEEILERYLGLVDTCATAKEFISQSKEYISNLLSALRRKRDSNDLISDFISSRKIIKKKIQKSLRNIIGLKMIKSSVTAMDKDQETVAIIRTLKEAESMTVELFEELLSSVAGAKSHLRQSRWSLVVSGLFRARKVSCQDYYNGSMAEFRDLDVALCSLIRASKGETRMRDRDEDLLQQKLREMDLNVRVIEERLEWLFKCLIKSRVSLLNMQSQLYS